MIWPFGVWLPLWAAWFLLFHSWKCCLTSFWLREPEQRKFGSSSSRNDFLFPFSGEWKNAAGDLWSASPKLHFPGGPFLWIKKAEKSHFCMKLWCGGGAPMSLSMRGQLQVDALHPAETHCTPESLQSGPVLLQLARRLWASNTQELLQEARDSN